MRVDSLRVAGIGPFRTEQVVDFRAFAGDGLFLIAGKTGAGKSSILDAIVYALYERLPRYDVRGTERAIRSDHAEPGDPSFVEVVFEVAQGRYRVRRSPEYARPKARGDGMTLTKAHAELWEWREPSGSAQVDEPSRRALEPDGAPLPDGDPRPDGDWVGVAAKPREVGQRLASLLPLTAEEFLQVVLLAQNRFHEFLVADSAERTTLLRALFATHRFNGLAERVDARRRVAGATFERAMAIVDDHERQFARLEQQTNETHARLTPDSTAALDTSSVTDPSADPRTAPHLAVRIDSASVRTARLVASAAAARAEADDEVAAAEDDLAKARAVADRQRRRDSALAELRRLEGRRAEVDRDRERLRNAAIAAPLMPLVEAGERTDRASDRAAQTAAQALSRDRRYASHPAVLRGAGPDDPAHPAHASAAAAAAADAERRRDEASSRLGLLEPVAHEERNRTTMARDLERARRAVTEEAERLQSVRRRLTDAPLARRTLEERLAGHAQIAATEQRATADLSAAEAARAAALRAERISARLADAERARGEARLAADRAVEHHNELLRARIDNAVALLAANLQSGAPCQVCGSTEHPAPALDGPGGELAADVSDAALRSAGDAADAARSALELAQEILDAIEDELREASREAGPRSVDQHDEAVAAALAARDAAAEAIRLRDETVEAIAAIDQSLASDNDQFERLTASQHDRLIDVANRERTLAELDERLARLCGDHASVADALADARAERDEAATTARALRELLETDRARDDSRAELGRAMSELDVNGSFADIRDDLDDDGWNRRLGAVRAAHLAPHDREELEAKVRGFDDRLTATTARLDEPDLAGLPTEPVDLDAPAERRQRAVETRDRALALSGDLGRIVGDLRELGQTARRAVADAEAERDRHDRLRRLADALRGQQTNELRMSLETFVLAAQMEEIVEAANERLASMTSGRYRLEHDDARRKGGGASGLGLRVLDAYTGRDRPTRSLSGGETFLASLALALGLSDTVTAQAGGVRLDTLFIDEGFGSLDTETLEVAMATLDALRAGGRTVGVISHVEAMHEQITARLEVRVTQRGDSIIEQR
ncbi:nuclease SbcCD subunit C [Pseudoclavibacter endophyticus]|uniref:Nuclease SbcCD subunit C n=1 Tax=Pseudoclavibacter endophyticus TaxID=1778590 RepID=A0A6H9WUB8_9MICO|nr:AAA family ATPase [Pseudoclavibacter endophyticus]KAB1650275.1 AAA family ATPase [Pseudoclavibacter endophyticus]GGA55585.1 nuclease SbcCD subunit C [Pseudoclavibacter endophyticus]